MSKASVLNLYNNTAVGEVDLHTDIFGLEVRQDILHRVVQWQLSKRRSGCHKSKQRNEVSGSTRKIYRQKGTGNARHGSIKAPVFVGGGIVFGPVVRSHAYKLNKKIRALGLKMALSLKVSEGKLKVVESLKADSYKTAAVAKVLKSADIKSALMIDDGIDINMGLAVSNIPNIDVLDVIGINVYDILKHQELVISTGALSKIKERFGC